MTVALFPSPAILECTPGQHLLAVLEHQHAITLRVLRAYPTDRLDLRPHDRARTARDLAWTFVLLRQIARRALTTGFDWSAPPRPFPTPPDSMEAILDAFEQEQRQLVDSLRNQSDARLAEPIEFLVAPKTLGPVPRLDFLWMLVFDEIHHRGQFSVYLRMAGGSVPSIYGPSADEPWL